MSFQVPPVFAIIMALSAAIATAASIENPMTDPLLVENSTEAHINLKMKGLFDLYDLDVDGVIIPLEMSLFLQRLPRFKHDVDLLVIQLRGIYRNYDINEDGRLDEAEFLEAAPPERDENEPNEDDALFIFETLDKNRDSRLSFKEFMETITSLSSHPPSPQEAFHQFELIDTNRDGIVSYDEFYVVLEAIPQSHTTVSDAQ